MSSMLIRLSVPGTDETGGPLPEPTYGGQLNPLGILGVPGVFAPTGSVEWLLEHFGLTAQGIYAAALELVGERVKG